MKYAIFKLNYVYDYMYSEQKKEWILVRGLVICRQKWYSKCNVENSCRIPPHLNTFSQGSELLIIDGFSTIYFIQLFLVLKVLILVVFFLSIYLLLQLLKN